MSLIEPAPLPAIEVEDLLPPLLRVRADEHHLRDVVRHVLRNSSEAMMSGGSLKLEARCIDGTAVLQLSDTGAGLSSEALKRAFQPFFSSKSQSTGLGLSMAKGFVEQSAGRFRIESRPGQGTTVTLWLPQDAAVYACAAGAAAPAYKLRTRMPRVLLVEAKDPRKPEFGTITMAFARVPGAPAGLTLQGWSTLDAQRNRSTIKLSNQRFNVAVADSNFRWVSPRKAGPRG